MYALVVILLSSLVTGFVLTSYALQRTMIEGFNIGRQLEDDLQSATILYCSGDLGSIYPGDTIVLDLFGDGRSEVSLSVGNWGCFELLTVSALQGREVRVGLFLLGVGKEDLEPVGLYLSDKGRFLSVSGDTRLSGICYLPAGTARVSSIEGQHFRYEEIVYGKVLKSGSSLANPDSGVFNFHNSYMGGHFRDADTVVNIYDLVSDKLERSFREPTLVVTGFDHLILDGINASGNIVFISDSSITIKEDTFLSDVILISREIMIHDGFSGSLQAFASATITLGSNCLLKLPSVLVVSQSSNDSYRPQDSLIVRLGPESIVCGNIFLGAIGLPCFFVSEKGSRVIGQIYCPGQVELGGIVEGSVFCDGFYLRTSRSWYLNHLLNNWIEFDKLPSMFAGVDIFKTAKRKTLIKWLH